MANQKIPKGYQKTKVGIIPKDWECLPASNYFSKSIQKGYEGLEIYSVTLKDGLQKRVDLKRDTVTDMALEDSLLIKEGDLVYNTMRMWQGALGLAKTEGVVSPAYIVIRPNEKMDSEYAFYLLKSYTYLHYLTSYSYGLTSDRLRLYYKDFGMIPFITPPLKEQKKIVEILKTWDKAIELKQKLIEQKELLKKGLMQKLLSGEKRVDGFSDEWKSKRLGELCTIKTGKLNANAMTENGRYPYFTCAKEIYKIDIFAFDTEALLISGNGANVGYVHYYKGKFNAYQRTYVLDKFTNNIIFIKYILDKYLSIQIDKEKNDGNTPYITLPTLTTMKIKLPPLEEQEKIANILSLADHEIELLKDELIALKDQKKSLMQKLLSGKVRVKV